jgi:hypothetical protein
VITPGAYGGTVTRRDKGAAAINARQGMRQEEAPARARGERIALALALAIALAGALLSSCGTSIDPGADGGPSLDSGATAADGGTTGGARVDCLDRRHFADDPCLRPWDVAPGTIGAGPPFTEALHGAALEGSTLLVAVGTTDRPGFVMSVDLATGDRTVRSGHYEDPASGLRTVGAGLALDRPSDVEVFADGWYVLTTEGVVRVDPATGDRTLARDFAPCEAQSEQAPHQIALLGMAMDDAGTAYVPATNGVTGSGVVGLGADGSCRVVSWSPHPGQVGVGSGPRGGAERFAGLMFEDGALWGTVFTAEALYRIDPSSGDRMIVSTSYDGAPIGSGDELAVEGFIAAIGPGRLALTGLGPSMPIHVVEVDLATGARQSRPALGGPLVAEPPGKGPIVVHPFLAGAVILGVDEALVVLERESGNSFLLSR